MEAVLAFRRGNMPDLVKVTIARARMDRTGKLACRNVDSFQKGEENDEAKRSPSQESPLNSPPRGHTGETLDHSATREQSIALSPRPGSHMERSSRPKAGIGDELESYPSPRAARVRPSNGERPPLNPIAGEIADPFVEQWQSFQSPNHAAIQFDGDLEEYGPSHAVPRRLLPLSPASNPANGWHVTIRLIEARDLLAGRGHTGASQQDALPARKQRKSGCSMCCLMTRDCV
jgi:hypothetical protein